MMRWLVPFFALAACDVASPPIDLETSFIETPNEGYQVVADIMTASASAGLIAGGCDGFVVNKPEKDRYLDWMLNDWDRLAREDPKTFNAMMRRMGGPLTADDMVNRNGNAIKEFVDDFQVGKFLAVNAGLSIDVAGRMGGLLVRNGLAPSCSDAEREVAQGTLTGTFLREVTSDVFNPTQTAPVPMPEFADDSNDDGIVRLPDGRPSDSAPFRMPPRN